MHLVTAVHGGLVADDCRAVRVPADGIAAAEDGERAEAFQTRDVPPESRVGGVHAVVDARLQPSIRGDKARAERREAATHIETFERQAQRLISALAAADACANGAQQLMR